MECYEETTVVLRPPKLDTTAMGTSHLMNPHLHYSGPPDLCLSGEHRQKHLMSIAGSNRETWREFRDGGLGSNPGEDMDVCKCIVPVRHEGTLNSRRAANPLVRLVEGEERLEASDHPQRVLPLNWGGIEPNRTVT
ncbi:uncharacterized protein TNCV_1536831 [Trichonephila clavipes]|nr:uncharacterized protein TNCV_1536831 [Trichonephila clavipes]